MKKIHFLLITNLIIEIISDCIVYNEIYGCIEDNKIDTQYDKFQTPPRNISDENYEETYQDMHYLVGYAQLKYNSEKTSCTIKFINFINDLKLSSEGITDYKMIYKFGDIIQENDSIIFTPKNNTYKYGLPISASIFINDKEFAKLELEEEYFIWDNPSINLDEKYNNGSKGVIVDLFGWPYDDIAEECEFLKVAGYLGVKITPPNESILTNLTLEDGEMNPWWYYFQTVSYKLKSRMGDKKQLKNMINKCRNNNIRIYAEIVVNNMVQNGYDTYKIHKNEDCTEWGPKSGSAGSPFWTTKGTYGTNEYSGQFPVFEFPSVPYFSSHFHCFKKIQNWGDSFHLDYYSVDGLIDLNTDLDYVQQRIADFLTELLSIGISGFSLNNGKNISPLSYSKILGKLRENLGDVDFPDDFLLYLEIPLKDNNAFWDLMCSNGGDYNFAQPFVNKMKSEGLSDNDIIKIKINIEDHFTPYCNNNENDWKIEQKRQINSIENQNIQKIGNENNLINNINITSHINDYVNMLKDNKYDYQIKIVFSSYKMINGAQGIPDGYSDCSTTIEGCNKSVPYVKAYEPLSKGYDNVSDGNYTRIHRNIDIVNAMRFWMGFNNNLTEEELYKNEIAKWQLMNNDMNNTLNNDRNNDTNNDMNNDQLVISSDSKKLCGIEDYFNEICEIKGVTTDIKIEELISEIEDGITDGSLDDLLLSVINDTKKDLIIKENNTLVVITSAYNQNNKDYKNMSTIQLGECENILRQIYNISESNTIIILKVEYYKQGLLIPIIEYEVFHPISKEKLNLNYCNKTSIELAIPVTIDEENLNKYNSSDEYYNDICYPSTTNYSTDIILEDRRNEYLDNNLSLCESNCNYTGYDLKKKKVLCECQAKSKFKFLTNINFNAKILLNNFKDLKKHLNLDIFKCHYILFTKVGFTKNIGNYILLFIILFEIVSLNYFVIYGYDNYKNSIIKMLKMMKESKEKNKYIINKNDNENNTINCDLKDNDKNSNLNNKDNNTILEKEKINDNKNKDKEKIIKNPPKKMIKLLSKIKKKKTFDLYNTFTFNKKILNSNNKNNDRALYSKPNNITINSNSNKYSKNTLFSGFINQKNIISKNSNEIINTNCYNDYELNDLPFTKALEIDKRTYFQYYLSLLKSQNLLLFTFFNYNDYNPMVIKICFFLFSFSLCLAVNTLFFTDSTMHKIYEDEGHYDLIYQLPHLIYSIIITSLFKYLIKYISMSQTEVLKLKNSNLFDDFENDLINLFKCLIIKFAVFFNISLLLLFIFWYYISCFCAVYRNTQIYLFEDTFISFSSSILYKFIVYLLPSALRIQALKENYYNRECIFKISKILQYI